MALRMSGVGTSAADASNCTSSDTQRAKQTHTKPRPIDLVDLSKPGRLRVGHMLTLFSVSHSTLYARMAAGTIPKADGKDGRPYWLTSTVKPLLEK